MKTTVCLIFLVFTCAIQFVYSISKTSPPNRIVHNGNSIFLSGINVAWGPYVSFGQDMNSLDPKCTSSACNKERTYIETVFSTVSAKGGNSIRFWLHPDGSSLPVQNADYSNRLIDGITSAELASLAFVLDLGNKYNVLVNLCLWSFDMVNDQGYGAAYGLWNKILTNDINLNSYIDNWVIPAVKSISKYSSSSLLSLEVFNEPEGMISQGTTFKWGWTSCVSNSPDCAKVSILTAQRFANLVSSAIHTIDKNIKVTVGSWSYHANSNILGETNIWSDNALIAAGGKVNGVLDFYQIHYYNWAYPNFSPFVHNATTWAVYDKPHVIGEFPNNPTPYTAASPSNGEYIYEKLYQTGYAGAWGWCYNCDADAEFTKETYLSNMEFMKKTYPTSV